MFEIKVGQISKFLVVVLLKNFIRGVQVVVQDIAVHLLDVPHNMFLQPRVRWCSLIDFYSKFVPFFFFVTLQ